MFILDFTALWLKYGAVIAGKSGVWGFVSGFVRAPSPPVDTTEETGDTDGDRAVFVSAVSAETWQRPSPAV